MAKPCLRCLQEFSVGGNSYKPGQNISLKDVASWPEGSLSRRLEHRFVEHAVTGELLHEEVMPEDVVRLRQRSA